MKRRQEFDSSFSESEEVKKPRHFDDEDIIDILFEDFDGQFDAYSSNTDSAESGSIVSAEKRARPYFKPSLPRILKRDIRKKIPLMFTNVMNSSDFSMLSSFLRTFCRNDTSFTQSAHVVKYDQNLRIDMPTLEHLVYFLGGFQTLSPDLTFRLSTFQLKQRSDMEGTEIICKVDVHCTMLYPVNPGHMAEHILDHLPLPSEISRPTLLTPNDVKTHYLDNYDLFNPASFHSLGIPVLEQPMTKDLSLDLTFKVDELNRIERISKAVVIPGDFHPCGIPISAN